MFSEKNQQQEKNSATAGSDGRDKSHVTLNLNFFSSKRTKIRVGNDSAITWLQAIQVLMKCEGHS